MKHQFPQTENKLLHWRTHLSRRFLLDSCIRPYNDCNHETFNFMGPGATMQATVLCWPPNKNIFSLVIFYQGCDARKRLLIISSKNFNLPNNFFSKCFFKVHCKKRLDDVSQHKTFKASTFWGRFLSSEISKALHKRLLKKINFVSNEFQSMTFEAKSNNYKKKVFPHFLTMKDCENYKLKKMIGRQSEQSIS